jgi:hypothetical protein
MTIFLNTSDIYRETLHCGKSTLEQLVDHVEYFGLGWKFWGLETIHVEQLEFSLLQ